MPLYKDFRISSLHSHRFAENNKCAVSGGKFSFLFKKSFIIAPMGVVLSASKSIILHIIWEDYVDKKNKRLNFTLKHQKLLTFF